jgi:hypothetical protein
MTCPHCGSPQTRRKRSGDGRGRVCGTCAGEFRPGRGRPKQPPRATPAPAPIRPPCGPWTGPEDALLRLVYPVGGLAAAAEAFPLDGTEIKP